MVSSRTYLHKSQELKARGLVLPFEAGKRVARGYADLGTEEFQLLAPRKTVSLFTGKPSEIPDEHITFFFRIPEIDELVEELTRHRVIVVGATFKDQRRWTLSLLVGGEPREFISDSLEEAFLDGLISILPAPKEVSRPPRLKTDKE